MFFAKSFEIALDILRNQIQHKQDFANQDSLFLDMIQEWCSYLDLSRAEKFYILEGFKSQKLFPRFVKDYKNDDVFITLYGDNNTATNITNFIGRLSEKPQRKNQKMDFYLLLAFVIVSVGYVLFLISEKQKKQNFRDQEIVLQENTFQGIKDNAILILVLSVKYEDVINELKSKKSIDPDLCDRLYYATQGLWLGSEQQYLNSLIESSFRSEETSIFSAYDVYFVKINLSDKDSGFESKASQLSRADGFRRLPKITQGIEISNRLPSKSYANIGAYNR